MLDMGFEPQIRKIVSQVSNHTCAVGLVLVARLGVRQSASMNELTCQHWPLGYMTFVFLDLIVHSHLWQRVENERLCVCKTFVAPGGKMLIKLCSRIC